MELNLSQALPVTHFHTKKIPNCSHSLKATTGTPVLPETANNGLNSSKTGDEVGK